MQGNYNRSPPKEVEPGPPRPSVRPCASAKANSS